MKLTTLSTCFCLLLLGLLSSCRSAAPAYDYRTLARAGIALGIDIDQDDNHNSMSKQPNGWECLIETEATAKEASTAPG